jgi:hypothetical protein
MGRDLVISDSNARDELKQLSNQPTVIYQLSRKQERFPKGDALNAIYLATFLQLKTFAALVPGVKSLLLSPIHRQVYGPNTSDKEAARPSTSSK